MDSKRNPAENGYAEATAGAWNKLIVTSIVLVALAVVWPLVSFQLMGAVAARLVARTWPFAVIDSITIIAPMVVLLWTWISYWQYVRALARRMEASGEGEGARSEESKPGSLLQRLELELEMLRLRIFRGLCLTWSFLAVLLPLSVLLRFILVEI